MINSYFAELNYTFLTKIIEQEIFRQLIRHNYWSKKVQAFQSNATLVTLYL